jgi:hypothetical protein
MLLRAGKFHVQPKGWPKLTCSFPTLSPTSLRNMEMLRVTHWWAPASSGFLGIKKGWPRAFVNSGTQELKLFLSRSTSKVTTSQNPEFRT